MCSSEDCEKLWFLYKLEGELKGVSIEQFCIKQGVPYQVLTSGSGIVRNGLFLLRLWDVTKIPSQRSKRSISSIISIAFIPIPYHTIIATCKAQAVSVCEYLKQFFTACVNGRTDYENLTPMMLCQLVK